GRREARAARPVMTRDVSRTLVVVDLPPGAPESFAGAIGRGFSLSAAADRTVVQAGDPIQLTLTLRGDGSLDTASLPLLSADAGLSPTLFRLPSGKPAGKVDENQKTFEVTVRAMSEQVQEIPPIAYSWFDPELGRYETTRSNPIALSVKGANVIGASDVVGSGLDETNAVGSTTQSEAESVNRTAPTFTLSGADLAIVTEPSRLIGAAPWASPFTTAALYGIPLAAIGLALIGRRRAAIDPAILRRRRALAEGVETVSRAKGQSELEGTRAIAGALRTMLAEAPEARSPEVEDFLSECESVIYAPDSAQGTIAPTFVDRAVAIAQSIEKEGRR
ncbi:MAG: BatD family protein, partial [Planctomycetota bacterium]